MSNPQIQSRSPDGRCEVANDRAAITTLGQQIVEAAERAGYSEASRFAVRLALEEAIVNAFKHGHKDLPASETVTVEFEMDSESIRLVVSDKGPGFVPNDVPDPTSDENLTKTSGRGLLLMRAYMTKITHNKVGNQIIMIYSKPVKD